MDAGAEFSQETLLELASFVENIKTEQERLQAEAEEQKKDPVIKDMFGGDGDGNE